MTENETDVTKLVKWENGPLLEAAMTEIPVILDRTDESKAQVTKRMNPLLDRNAPLDEKKGRQTVFLVPEKGEDIEQQVKTGFVVIATLTLDPLRRDLAISLALRNQFVTIVVESPKLDVDLKKGIAMMIIDRFSGRIQDINWEGPEPTSPNQSQRNALAETIAGNLLETTTIRDAALLFHAAASIHGIVTFPCMEADVNWIELRWLRRPRNTSFIKGFRGQGIPNQETLDPPDVSVSSTRATHWHQCGSPYRRWLCVRRLDGQYSYRGLLVLARQRQLVISAVVQCSRHKPQFNRFHAALRHQSSNSLEVKFSREAGFGLWKDLLFKLRDSAMSFSLMNSIFFLQM
jgi:hypothetical protein